LNASTYELNRAKSAPGDALMPLSETIESFRMICDGEVDHIAEQAFFNVGSMEDVERRWSELQKEA